MSESLKIGFDAKRLFHNFSGLGNYARTLVLSLKKYYPQHQYYLFTPGLPEYSEFFSPFLDDFIIIKNESYMPDPLWRSWGCSKSINRLGLDIFHGLSQEIPYGINSATKSIVTIHDLIYERLPHLFNPIDVMLYKVKYRSSCSRAEKIIAISESTKRDIDEYYHLANKTSVIYQALNPLYYGSQIENNIARENKYLFVGTINERKGLADIIKAYSIMQEQDRIPIHILGTMKSYGESLRKEIYHHNLSHCFIFRESITDLELKKEYSKAKALIYPSIYEGFGLPLAEALSQGCPVITTDVSSMPEAVGKNAIFIKPNDTDSLAKILSDISKGLVNLNEISSGGSSYIQSKFDPEILSNQINNLYTDLLS